MIGVVDGAYGPRINKRSLGSSHSSHYREAGNHLRNNCGRTNWIASISGSLLTIKWGSREGIRCHRFYDRHIGTRELVLLLY